MRRFENTTPPHNKFWEIEVVPVHSNKIPYSGTEYEVRKFWGKIGTFGQTKSKKFAFSAFADQYVAIEIASKLAKGYHEIGNVTYKFTSDFGRSISVVNFDNTSQNQLAPPSRPQTICAACRKNQSTSATDRCSDCIRNKRTISNKPEEKKDRFELIELD